MDSIPVQLSQIVEQLESVPDLSADEVVSALFIVRLGDGLHKAVNGTFLTLSLVNRLREKLEVSELHLELDVFHTRWSLPRGTASVAHQINWDYDMYSVFVLSNIGRKVLNGSLTPLDGLKLIREHESKNDYVTLEGWYRSFPTRMFISPLMAASCATVFFGGTWIDFGFAAACGMGAGIVAWIGTLHEQLNRVMDYLAAIVVAMIAAAGFVAYPDATCFSAQIIGSLYWFLYGTAFVLSLYEITNNQLTVGTTRFVFAVVKSYGLAFGAFLGLYFAGYAGSDRLDSILVQDCSEQEYQIPDIWYLLLFPMAAVACLMQFRVSLRNWPICFLVQLIAYGSQYVLLDVWKYPDLLANLIPAFLTTLASHIFVYTFPRLKLSVLENGDYFYNEMEMRGLAVDEEKLDQATTWPSPRDLEEEQRLNTGNSIEPPIPSLVPDPLSNHNGDANGAANGGGAVDVSAVTFIDNKSNDGYVAEDKNSYSRSGTWFCLLPALYLLVPGSKLLQNAVIGLLNSLSTTKPEGDMDSLATSWLEIGLSQAVGLRLGFALLWAVSELWRRLCNSCQNCRRAGNEV